MATLAAQLIAPDGRWQFDDPAAAQQAFGGIRPWLVVLMPMLVVSLLDRSYTGAKLAEALERVGIITSKSTVPGETRSPRQTSGVRFGSPALTTRGATEAQMRQIARAVARVAAMPATAGFLSH